MKKYHCVGPTFKLRKRSRGLTFKLWREVLWSLFQILEGHSVLPLNSEVVPGPWVPRSWVLGRRVLVPFLLHSVHSSRSNLLKKISSSSLQWPAVSKIIKHCFRTHYWFMFDLCLTQWLVYVYYGLRWHWFIETCRLLP